jgi:dipeptidase D
MKMSEDIKNLKPSGLWDVFYSLTQIPRPSKKELKAAQFVKAFGESLGLETVMDEVGNVIIRKPATPGFETKKGVILQAHIDMVPQANSGVPFNFETNAIDAYVDGDWVTARNTTLGADNGIGVAAALAILSDRTVQHGPLEVLVTIDEETGMTGAFALKSNLLNGEILINLDSEDEDDLSVGCAGGMDVNFSFQLLKNTFSGEGKAFNLTVSGLKGGHSGLDIHLGRANACKLAGLALKELIVSCGARLASLKCGNMRNAIPREGIALIVIPENKVEAAKLKVADFQERWSNEYGRTEPHMKISLAEAADPEFLFDAMCQDDVVNAICAAPNGIIRMSDSMPGVVETSTNLSIVASDGEKIEGMCLVRSFVDSAKMDVASMLESCFRLGGADVSFSGSYPGWKPNPDSEILATMKETFRKQKGQEAKVVAMHAGLECGILGSVYTHWDMISVGPTIRFPHSPDEKVHIGSVANFWNFLTEALQHVPEVRN